MKRIRRNTDGTYTYRGHRLNEHGRLSLRRHAGDLETQVELASTTVSERDRFTLAEMLRRNGEPVVDAQGVAAYEVTPHELEAVLRMDGALLTAEVQA